jgi:hypothetical protein
MNAKDLIGTWRGGGQKVFNRDGGVKDAIGPEAPGYLVYTAEGYMMVISTDPRGLPSGDPSKLSTAEKAKCADACVSYFGKYDVTNGDVLHHVEVALFPGWMGKTRVRHATLEGKRMTFITDPDADGCVSHIYWEKI